MKNNHELQVTVALKNKLRKEIRGKRDKIAAYERKNKSEIIAEKFYLTDYYTKAYKILAYYPFGSEVDTTLLIIRALENNKSIILPKVFDRELKLYYLDKLSGQLEKSKYGIMEPITRFCRPAKIKDIELAIIPGLGFDKNLNRLGYGGGFYDRLLTLIPEEIKKIALCFDIQILDSIPATEHDIKIDVLITESKIYHR
jgi:5-formyltetrahydrofolate cyclo-ligase